MKKNVIRAVFAAALFSTTALTAIAMAPPMAHADDKPDTKVGKAMNAPLAAASKAIQDKDYPSALAAIKLAQAVPDQTPFETYMVNKFLAFIEINLQDLAAATPAAEAAADSPAMPDVDAKGNLFNALILSVQAKQYDKAAGYGQRLEAIGPLDAKTDAMVAVAYYNLKDSAHAQQYAQKSLDASKAAGTPPEQNATTIVMNAEAESDPAAALHLFEQQVVANGKAEDWDKLIGVSLGTKGLSNADALNMYRVLYIQGPMLTGDDYTYTGNLAEAERDYKEAATVLEAGLSAGKISSAPTLEKLRGEAASDEKIISQAIVAAQKSKRGEDAIQIAQDLWGYGRYADVEAMARAAQSKGSKDPAESTNLIGMAQIAQGQYDAGIATLAQVNGSAGHMRVAQLWTLYAQYKQKQAAAAAPAAPPPASH